MVQNDSASSLSLEIVYYYDNNNEISEIRIYRKINTYYDNDGNIIKSIIEIRFNLDQNG
jgi:hypothetical protein